MVGFVKRTFGLAIKKHLRCPFIDITINELMNSDTRFVLKHVAKYPKKLKIVFQWLFIDGAALHAHQTFFKKNEI